MALPLSSRISAIQPSPTVALNARATALGKEGINVLNFAVGEPDFPTPQLVVDKAIASLKAGRTKYGPAGGGPELRKAIAAKLKRDNRVDFSPDHIVVGIGAKEILFHTFLAILNEGDEVLVPNPYWVSYADQILAAGARAVTLPLPEDLVKSPPIDVAAIEKMATAKTRAFVFNSPNNPAGYVLSKSELIKLGEFLKKKGWWIIADEIYEYLAFDSPHYSLLELFPELADRYILINGMSKGFAMTGWRVGYAAGPAAVIKLVKSLQSHSSTCVPGFIEDAATVALHEGARLMAPEIEIFRKRRDIAATELGAIPHLDFFKPQGAFYVFLDVRNIIAKSANFKTGTTMALSERLLNEYHVALVPGEAFGAPGFLRLSYATSEDTLRQGIARLRQAFAAL